MYICVGKFKGKSIYKLILICCIFEFEFLFFLIQFLFKYRNVEVWGNMFNIQNNVGIVQKEIERLEKRCVNISNIM